MVDISKVLDGAANPVIRASERIVGNSPGFVLTSDNPKEFVDNLKNSVKLGGQETRGDLKDFGINKVLDIADGINPALGNFGRSILGRGNVDKTRYPPDPLQAPATSWYTLGRKRRDPLLAFEWDVNMPDLGTAYLPKSYVEEIQINMANVTEWSVFRNGIQQYYAGFPDNGTLTITCYEDNRLTTMSYFMTWLGLIQNQKDGTFNAPADYMKDIIVTVQAPVNGGGGMQDVGYMTVHAVFPKDRQGLNLSSGTSERQRIQVTFAVNNVSYVALMPPDAEMASALSSASKNPALSFLGKLAQLISPSNDPSQPVFAVNAASSALDRMKTMAGLGVKAPVN